MMLYGLVSSVVGALPSSPPSHEDLLIDDSLVLCPVVYTLRLQHLEEALALSERFQRLQSAQRT
eukprot:4253694-Amphidinium_carterae.1